MKCSICKKKIETQFLDKIIGTYIKKDGKLIAICRDCQKRFKTKEDIIASIA